jgi:hypothetical protein
MNPSTYEQNQISLISYCIHALLFPFSLLFCILSLFHLKEFDYQNHIYSIILIFAPIVCFFLWLGYVFKKYQLKKRILSHILFVIVLTGFALLFINDFFSNYSNFNPFDRVNLMEYFGSTAVSAYGTYSNYSVDEDTYGDSYQLVSRYYYPKQELDSLRFPNTVCEPHPSAKKAVMDLERKYDPFDLNYDCSILYSELVAELLGVDAWCKNSVHPIKPLNLMIVGHFYIYISMICIPWALMLSIASLIFYPKEHLRRYVEGGWLQ